MAGEYLTVEQTAVRLSRHAETIRRMMRAGRLEFVKLGQKYLVSELAIAKLLLDETVAVADDKEAKKKAVKRTMPPKRPPATAKTAARKKKR